MKKKTPLYVHKKTAKGKTYYYFDTGERDDGGNRMLKRLPDIRAHGFAAAYQGAKSARTRHSGDRSAKTFDWLVKLFERSPEYRALAHNSQRSYSLHLAYANDHLRNRHGKSAPLSIVTAEQLLILRDKYADEPGKANAIVRSVRALYYWGGKPGRQYVRKEAVAGVDLLEVGEHQPWPLHLVEEALDDPTIRLPVALLYFLGQRIGDTVRLGRSNLAQGVISLTQEKTGTTLHIPLHKRLARIIDQDVPKGQLMFLLAEKGTPVTESGLRQRIQKWALGRGYKVVPHGLRKNAVNALIKAGCSTAEVSAITGQDLKTIELYAKQRDREELGRTAILKFEAKNKA